MRPMLACNADEALISRHLRQTYLLVSPKLDGIRGIVKDGLLLSRSLKPIRNYHVQGELGHSIFNGLDGELICGEPTAPDVYRKSTSAFMSFEGEPEWAFFVFDDYTRKVPFVARHDSVRDFLGDRKHQPNLSPKNGVRVLPHEQAVTYEEVLDYEARCVKMGYEGIILRRPDMPYKFNRSTPREGGMMKLKRFLDSEARIVGMEERLHNANPAEEDELGLTTRSSAQDGKVPTDTMGNLVVVDLASGVEFRIGTGFTEGERVHFWSGDMIGKVVKYKYLPVGVKDKPRHPVFLGMRDVEDM